MAPVLSAGVTTSSRVFLSLLLGWEGETTPRLAGAEGQRVSHFYK